MPDRFKYECAPTPQYAALLDEPIVQRKTSADPNRVNRIFEMALMEFQWEGFTCLDRTPHGRQCRLVTVYDYEALTTPAYVITITF